MEVCPTPPWQYKRQAREAWGFDTPVLLGNGHCTTVLAVCAARLQSVSRRYNVQALMPLPIFGYTFTRPSELTQRDGTLPTPYQKGTRHVPL